MAKRYLIAEEVGDAEPATIEFGPLVGSQGASILGLSLPTQPYVQIHGLDCTSIVSREAVSGSGGGRIVDSSSRAGLREAIIQERGREMRSFSFNVDGAKDDIQRFIEECNNAPEDSDFFPYDNSMCAYLKYSHALSNAPLITHDGNFYHAIAEVQSRENCLFGPRQGILYRTDAALPLTESLENAGNLLGTLDYLQMSGHYDVELDSYTDDVKLSFNGQEIDLCARLMQNDQFRISRWAEVVHTYETDFGKTYGNLQRDLHGSDYVTYGVDGSIARGAFSMHPNSRLMMPFYGPLPVMETPFLEFNVTSFQGTPGVSVAFDASLSDIVEIDSNAIRLGYNKIYVPDANGKSFFAMGITTGSGSNIVLSSARGEVHRYLSPSLMPSVERGESFSMSISDGSTSNHRLKSLQALYRDAYWF